MLVFSFWTVLLSIVTDPSIDPNPQILLSLLLLLIILIIIIIIINNYNYYKYYY